MSEALNELASYLAEMRGALIASSDINFGELSLTAKSENLISLLTFLRDDSQCEFKCLVDLCGVDWPDRERRFDVVYNLLSVKLNQRIRVKVQTDETTPVPSAAPVSSRCGTSAAMWTCSARCSR